MSDRFFAGREDEIAFFGSMLDGQNLSRVLAVTGMGGIGKTELLRQFQHLADERGIPWARIDETMGADVPGILDAATQQLAARGIDLEPLSDRLREYKRIKTLLTLATQTTAAPSPPPSEEYDLAAVHKLITAAFTEQDLRRFCRERPDFRPVLDRVGVRAGLADITDELVEYCDKQALLSDLLDQVQEINPRQYERHRAQVSPHGSPYTTRQPGYESGRIIRDVLKSAELELYQAQDRFWTEQLHASLQQVGRPLLLIFDGYEKLLHHDPWVRGLAEALTGDKVWLVLAGRFKLDTRWIGVSGVSKLPLDSLTLPESRSFLRHLGVSDPAAVKSIARFACGVPLALHLAAELALKYKIHDFGRAPERQQIINQLLHRLATAADPDETEVLLACAIPRSLTVPLIQKLLPSRDAAKVMADLHERSYSVHLAGLAVHDSIRESVYAKLKFENRPRFDELQKAAITYYDEQLATPDDEQRALGEDWHAQVRERLYHTLHLDEREGFQYFEAVYWQIDGRFQFAECLNLANSLLSFPSSDPRYANLGRRYRMHALLDLDQLEEARSIGLQTLQSEMALNARSEILNDLGRITTRLGRLEEAQRYLEEATALKRQVGDEPGLGRDLVRLADVHSHLHTEQGLKEIELLSEALSIFERVGNKYRQADAHYHLSFSYRGLGRWEEAEFHARAALTLAEAAEQGEYRATYQRACVLDVLAHIYRHRGMFKDAEAPAREALTLFRRLDLQYRIADALQGLAQIVLAHGSSQEAKVLLDEALSLAKRMNDPFTVSIIGKTYGQFYLREERLDEAQAAFESYLTAMHGFQEPLREALTHHHLGGVHQRRQEWPQAKAHLRAAIRFFYTKSNDTFRAGYSLYLFARVLLGEGHLSGGRQMLRFALAEAEKRGLVHVQARAHLSLAEVLLDEPDPDQEAIERHLATAGKLAEEQEYRDIARQVARLRETTPASQMTADSEAPAQEERSVTFVTQVLGGEVGKIVNIGSADEVNL